MRRAKERGERGFTLVEVTVAMGILATGLLAVSAAQLYAMRGARSGRHGSDAAEIAQTQIEQLQRVAWTDASIASTGGAWDPAGAGTPFDMQVETTSGDIVEQSYTWQRRVTDTVSPTGLVFLKTIDVRVQWDEPNRPGRSYTITTMRHNDERS